MKAKKGKNNIYWNDLEICIEEAKNYSTRKEIRDQNRACYNSIKKHEWDDLCFAHMEKRFGIWDDIEKCKREAEKYSCVAELKAKCRPCLRSIQKHGWQKICFENYKGYIVSKHTKPYYWQDLEHCRNMAEKYDSVKELYKAASGCVMSIREHGWESICYKHIPSFWKNKASHSVDYDKLENCLNEALRYKSRSELHNANRACHKKIKKHGWEDICFAHMRKATKLPGYWNDLEHCIGECNKYDSYDDFSDKSSPCKDAIKRNGWELICYKNFKDYKPWSFQKKDFINFTKIYKSVLELYYKNPELFSRLYYSNWFNEVNELMQEKVSILEEYAKELLFSYCQNEAKEYIMRYSFQVGSPYAYMTAKKNKWLDDICSHMQITGNYKQRCIYAALFADHTVYIGLSGNFERRVKSHLNDPKSAVYRYINETGEKPIFTLIHDYTNVEEARRLEGLYLEDYRRAGWKPLNIAETGCLGGSIQLTNEEIFEIVMEYDTLTDFIKDRKNIYQITLRREGMLAEIKKMLRSVKHDKYTKEDINKIVEKCNDFREFRLLHSGAYKRAKILGFLDEIRNRLPKGNSIKVKTIEEAQEIAKTCKSLSELRYKSESAAALLKKHKSSPIIGSS